MLEKNLKIERQWSFDLSKAIYSRNQYFFQLLLCDKRLTVFTKTTTFTFTEKNNHHITYLQ